MHHFQNNLERVRHKGFDSLQSYTSFNNKNIIIRDWTRSASSPFPQKCTMISEKGSFHNFHQTVTSKVFCWYISTFSNLKSLKQHFMYMSNCLVYIFALQTEILRFLPKRVGNRKDNRSSAREEATSPFITLAPWLTIVIIWDCTVEQMW